MKLEEMLESLPVEQWQIGQVYSYDWYDGPREGVCSLVHPKGEFYFELLDERYNPEGLDDRLFRLSELPAGSVKEVLTIVPELASPDETVRRRAKQQLAMIDARRQPTPLVIYSQDMEHILGCWKVVSAEIVNNWFTALGIP